MIDKKLLDILACPRCHGALEAEGEFLECHSCRLRFPVREGIPVLLVEEAEEVPRKDS
jgi:uncharacterized protein YbaR (Trm112 family)